MPLHVIVVLALIQGLTEFLPVSSSAHLELWHQYAGPTPQDLSLDIAVHVGTLAAAIIYFRAEVVILWRGLLKLARFDLMHAESHAALCLITSTLPVGAVGAVLVLTGWIEALRSLAVIGWAMILFGLLLWWFDRRAGTGRTAQEWTMRDAWVMGMWQALSLIPGTSRSGAAITGGLARGYERRDAARLAMLMSIPTIAASGVLLVGQLARTGDLSLGLDAVLAALLAFVAGLGALALMMRLLQTTSYGPYVLYRVILGTILLVIAYS